MGKSRTEEINRTQIAKNTIGISVIRVVVRLVALVRQLLIARFFGATGSTDAYFVVYQLQSVIGLFLGVGSLQASTTTMLIDAEVKGGKNSAKKLLSKILADQIVIGFIILILALFSFRYWGKILVPGFTSESSKYLYGLSMYMFPAAVITAVMFIASSGLHSKRIFIPSEIANFIITITLLTVIAIFHDYLKIYSLGLGHILGASIALVFILFVLRKKGLGSIGKPDFSDPAIKKTVSQSIMVIVFMLASQIFKIFERFLASFLPAGKITSLSLAQMIVGAIIFVVAHPFLLVMHTDLSKTYSNKNYKKFSEQLNRILGSLFFLFIPISAGLFAMAKPLVFILLRQGKFSVQASIDTSLAIRIFAVGFLFQGLNLFLARVLMATQMTKKLAIISTYTWLGGMVLDWFMVKQFGFKGLAITFVIVFIIQDIILFRLVSNEIGFAIKPLCKTVARVIISSAIMYVVVHYLVGLFDFQIVGFEQKIIKAVILSAISIAGGGLYILLSHLLGCEYPKIVYNILFKKTIK